MLKTNNKAWVKVYVYEVGRQNDTFIYLSIYLPRGGPGARPSSKTRLSRYETSAAPKRRCETGKAERGDTNHTHILYETSTAPRRCKREKGRHLHSTVVQYSTHVRFMHTHDDLHLPGTQPLNCSTHTTRWTATAADTGL